MDNITDVVDSVIKGNPIWNFETIVNQILRLKNKFTLNSLRSQILYSLPTEMMSLL